MKRHLEHNKHRTKDSGTDKFNNDDESSTKRRKLDEEEQEMDEISFESIDIEDRESKSIKDITVMHKDIMIPGKRFNLDFSSVCELNEL